MSKENGADNRAPAGRQPRWQTLVLPAEHGSWSLVSEPILLGLLAAPSWSGVLMALAAFAAFLAYQPFSIVWADRRRGRTYQRTTAATRYALVLALVAAALGLLALWLVGLVVALPFLVAAPLFAVFLVYDQRPGRHWQAELAAPAGFAAIAAAIALGAGWTLIPALALWSVMVARAVPAVLYVRARLRLVKDKPARPWLAISAHLLALALAAVLVWLRLLPFTAIVALLILLARCLFGLSPYRLNITIKTFGFVETGFGLLTALLIAAGYWFM